MTAVAEPIVIVGSSVAGVSIADALRAGGHSGDIVLIDREARLPYDKPPLSKAVLSDAEIDENATLLRPEWHYADRGIELLTGDGVVAIDAAARTLTLTSGATQRAGAIVLATGARPRRLLCPAPEGVLTLRSWADALAVRAAVRDDGPLLIVGAGLIGLEVAAAAVRPGRQVTLIEAAPRALARLPVAALVERVIARYKAEGAVFRMGVSVDRIEAADGGYRVHASDGVTHAAAHVLVSIGADPDVALAERAGLGIGDGILVDECCASSAPGIYAIGDCAARLDRATGRHRRHEHWRSAQLQGEVAAAAILGMRHDAFDPGWCWSDQFDWRIEFAGHPAPADRIVRRDTARGSIWFCLEGARLTGLAAINGGNDVRAALRMMERGISGADYQLVDPAVDLRHLLKAA